MSQTFLHRPTRRGPLWAAAIVARIFAPKNMCTREEEESTTAIAVVKRGITVTGAEVARKLTGIGVGNLKRV